MARVFIVSAFLLTSCGKLQEFRQDQALLEQGLKLEPLTPLHKALTEASK